jgi:hypothetical protein
MTKEKIIAIIEQEHPITYNGIKVELNTNDSVIGMFVRADDYKELKEKNVWRFVRKPDIQQWNSSKNLDLTELINGNLIIDIAIL